MALTWLLSWPGLGQEPGKLPPSPAINPAQARLDQTIGGLDGPGLVVASSDRAGMIAVGGEGGTIQYWAKDVAQGIRAGGRTPNQLMAHIGPVTALAWGGGTVLASAGADQDVVQRATQVLADSLG